MKPKPIRKKVVNSTTAAQAIGDQAKPMTDEDIFTLVSYGLRTEPRLFEVLFPAVQLRNKRVYIWLYERKCLVERGPREELNIVRFVNKEEAKMFRDVLNHEFPNVVARVTYGPDHRRVCGEA